MYARQQGQQCHQQGQHEAQPLVSQEGMARQAMQQEQIQQHVSHQRQMQDQQSLMEQQQIQPPPYLMYSPLWRNDPHPNSTSNNNNNGEADESSTNGVMNNNPVTGNKEFYSSSSVAEGAESEGSSFDDADAAAGSRRKKNKKMNKMIWQKQKQEKKYYTKDSPYPIYLSTPPMSGQTDLFFSTQNYHNLMGGDASTATVTSPPTDSSSISNISETTAEIAAATKTKTTKTATVADKGDYRRATNRAPSRAGIHSKPHNLHNIAGKEETTIHTEPVVVVGMDITHLPRQTQFVVCAIGVFGFSLLYGYLQELISVTICNRKLGLYLATVQFSGYTILSYFLRTYVNKKRQRLHQKMSNPPPTNHKKVPWSYYAGVSLLRAIDLAMTNLAMQYINYPAKTLMKSSRIVFTMVFGVLIGNKKYQLMDYVVVACMVFGLAVFMHADANSSAVFHPMGVIMLTISLICDGAVSNYSEHIMSHYNIGQDEFIFNMYSISLIAITVAAAYNGDLISGITWMSQPGTYEEMLKNNAADIINSNNATLSTTWSVTGKIVVIVLFSSMGFIGSSFSAAITKHFGALAMSITSTARKATTVFLSFFLFDNACTLEHIGGVIVFLIALTTKSLRRTSKKHRHHHRQHTPKKQLHQHRHQNKSGKYSKSRSRSFFQFQNFSLRPFFGSNDVSNAKKNTPTMSPKSRSLTGSPVASFMMDRMDVEMANNASPSKNNPALRSRSNNSTPSQSPVLGHHPDLTNRARTPIERSLSGEGGNLQQYHHVVVAGTHIV